MAGVVGECVALAERAVDQAAGHAVDAGSSADADGADAATGEQAVVAFGIAGVSAGVSVMRWPSRLAATGLDVQPLR